MENSVSQELNLLREELEKIDVKVQSGEREWLDSRRPEALRILREGSVLPNWVATMAQGPSLASSDELIGGARAIFGKEPGVVLQLLKDSHDDSKGANPYENVTEAQVGAALENASVKENWNSAPWSSFLLELGGTTLGVLAGKKTIDLARSGPGAPRKKMGLAKAAMVSAPVGMTAGFMAGEDSMSSGYLSDDRLVGGGIGFGTSVLTGPFSKLAERGISHVGQKFTGAKRWARLGRDKAREMVKQGIFRDLTTPEEAIARINANTNTPLVLADTGDNTRRLLEGTFQLPGMGASIAGKYLRSRLEGRSVRMNTILSELYGSKSSYYDTFQAMAEARSRKGSRLYNQAFKMDIPVTPELKQLLRTPAMQEAFEKGMSMARNKGQRSPFRVNAEGDIIHQRSGEKATTVNTEFLHWMKLGMDDLAFPVMPEGGTGRTAQQMVRDVRNDFIAFIDSKNGQYRIARNTWAGDSSMMEWMERGRKLLREDTGELYADLSKASKSELEAFRLGSMQALKDQVETSVDGANVARKLFNRPKRREQIRMTFARGEEGDKAFEQFMANLNDESAAAITEQTALGQSRPMGRQAVRDEIEAPITRSGDFGGGGGISQMFINALADDENFRFDQYREGVGVELARLLTQRGGLDEVLKQLNQGVKITDALRSTAPGLLSILTNPVVTGSMTGQVPQQFLNREQQTFVAPAIQP